MTVFSDTKTKPPVGYLGDDKRDPLSDSPTPNSYRQERSHISSLYCIPQILLLSVKE